MRIISKNRPLTTVPIVHEHSQELIEINRVLAAHPEIGEIATKDLIRPGVDFTKGRNGMTGEQTVRGAILKQMKQWTYDELSFHVVDSRTYRWFCRFPAMGHVPKKSALNANIKSLSKETWEQINRVILSVARKLGIEDGKMSRVDCTVVPTNIHHPLDCELLWDSVRVLVRLMVAVSELVHGFTFRDRSRTAKQTAFKVKLARKKGERKKLYIKLMKATKKTINSATQAISELADQEFFEAILAVRAELLTDALREYIGLAKQVIDQTHRRVIDGEQVPAQDKLVSIFEPHSDIIKKGGRETEFGHKVCLNVGRSGMVMDARILEGNPVDSTLAVEMMERHLVINGKTPLQVAMDGCFASKSNLESIKALGVRDVAFMKKRGLAIPDMVKSNYVYKKLNNFRAGVEAIISFLKRALGLRRCTWKGLLSFESYVWSSIVSANLLTLARTRIARRKKVTDAQPQPVAA